jgi:hypothetical protein
MTLFVVRDLYAICRLTPEAVIPGWADSGSFSSITRTSDELSIVCKEDFVPASVRCERGWRCVAAEGTMDLSTVGVLASLATPLAEAGVTIFAVSTFDTDYVLVKDGQFEKAIAALREAGHRVN